MIVLIVIYVLVFIYVSICLISTDLLFLGRRAKTSYTDSKGEKAYYKLFEVGENLRCYDIEDCLDETDYYNINVDRIKRVNKKKSFE